MTTFIRYLNEAENKFKRGDIVSVTGEVDGVVFKNEKGKVLSTDYSTSIEFTRPIKEISNGKTYGHSGDGTGKGGYCWDIDVRLIKPYYKPSKNIKQLKFD